MKKKKQKSFFRYVIFINSIKNNTFMLICLANGIIFVTFAVSGNRQVGNKKRKQEYGKNNC